jgi:hypothetical protein
MLGLLFVLPIGFVVAAVVLLARRQFQSVLAGCLFAAAAVAITIWSIKQSHSSTAGIGYIGVPFIGSIAGLLGLAFGASLRTDRTQEKLGGALALLAAFVLGGVILKGGIETRDRNIVRNEAQAEFSAEVGRDRDSLEVQLKSRPGSERAYLDSAIRARMNDRAFLIAALPHDSISAGLLDTLANSPDLGITLEAVRNPGTASSTLERVYRTHTYPDYFFQALASHPSTPPKILRELYAQRPRPISGLDIWLAGNPSTPRDVLKALADSATETHVIAQLLENPSADCNVLGKLAKTLMQRQKKDADDMNVARLAEKVPEVCASAKDSAERS